MKINEFKRAYFPEEEDAGFHQNPSQPANQAFGANVQQGGFNF